MNRKKAVPTPLQRRQRELAWCLYISEGAAANIAHALAVNCVTFDEKDREAVLKAMRGLNQASAALRKRLINLN